MPKLAIAILPIIVWAILRPVASQETEQQELARILGDRLPGFSATQVAPSPIPGLYQVSIGSGVVYVTGDGRYLLSGKLIEWETGRDLTEDVLSKRRLSALSRVPKSRMIVFEPEDGAKHTITTFTDVDCHAGAPVTAKIP